MADLSPSDAAIEGFRLIGARWRAIVGWSIFNLVALVALFVILVVVLLGVVPFVGSREAAGAVGATAGAVILGLGTLLATLVIYCGLLRVEFRPDEPGFIHLRIGRDELRVLGAALLVIVMAILAIVALALATAGADRIAPAAAVVTALAGGFGFYLLMLRFGLTPVIAFAERRISLAESWRRTRGQTWRLLGMAVLVLCLTLLLAILIWIAVFLLSGFTTGFRDFELNGAEAFAAHPGRYLFQLAVQFLLAPLWLVIGQAPWIAAYRALKPGEA